MELRELIKKANWVFAKTYQDFAPHEYVSIDDYPQLGKVIKQKMEMDGVKKAFKFPGGSKKFKYLYFDGWRYWFTNDGDILNRCPEDQTLDWSEPEEVIDEALERIKEAR